MKKGATRCVWLVGKYAIKIPRLYSWRSFLNGLLANMTERELDCLAPELHAKVYYADRLGLLLIMQRANTLSYGHMVRLHKRFKLDKLFSDCESAGLPVERKYDNIGFINNKPVLIDFGS